MTKSLLCFSIFFISISINAQEITGQWNALLKVQGTQLRLIFHINKTENGYTTTMDSPDQGVKDIAATSTSFENNVLKITVDNAKMEYVGTLNNDQKIIGTFKQGNFSTPLNLSRDEAKKQELKRPQEPKEPFGYYTEEVTFQNTKDSITLAGTLTTPNKAGVFPVVILITGSGPQNRNEELLGHKPFLVLADYLTKNGIAVLRYDDRGIAKSKGNFKTATTADFATDVEAAVKYLQTRKEINQHRIGLIGHSEGGVIAPMVASRNKNINFIVLLAGTGLQGNELLLLQKELIEKADGVDEVSIQKGKASNKGAFDIVIKSSNTESLKNELKAYYRELLKDTTNSIKPKGIGNTDFINMQVKQLTSPWWQYFIKYNPEEALQKVKCSVLAINGEKDLQVPAKENLSAIKQALDKGKNRKYTIKALPNLNHLFQECKTGSPNEYGDIEQTFSPIALNIVTNWILGVVK